MSSLLSDHQRALGEMILGQDDAATKRLARAPQGADLPERLKIHTDAYPVRIAEALREAFPALVHILGNQAFESLAALYAQTAALKHRNLNHVGAGLAEFLEIHGLADDLPFLPDLARLEWAVIESFHSAIEAHFDPLSRAKWQLSDWAEARIVFQPGLRFVRSPWPIRELRDARHLERSEIDIDLVGRADQLLVYRQGFEVVTETIGNAEACAIDWLLEGRSLGEVAEELGAPVANSDPIAKSFQRWISLGLIVSCA